MKKSLLYFLTAIMLFAVSCSESYDDSALVGRVDNLENRVAKLEELCKQMNTNISSLQTLVAALQNNDYVTGVTPITKSGVTIGYTITFAKSQPITIYHGENGKDGQNGTDGKDGHTPIIGVKQNTDGIYYWTLDGDWLLDTDGNKIKAQGTDGKNGEDGTNGKDGIVPQLKIENDYWYISYDNGASWIQLDRAVGDVGDTFFQDIYIENGYVNFVIEDEVIKIAYTSDVVLILVCEQEGDVKNKLTDQQKRTVTHLVIEGVATGDDVRYIADQMLVLEKLDLRKSTVTAIPDYAFCKGGLKYGKESLREIYLPTTCTSIGHYAFYGCINLRILSAPNAVDIGADAIAYCNIDKVVASLGGNVYASSNSRIQRFEYYNSAKTANSLSGIEVDTIFCHKGIESIGHFGSNYKNVIFEEPASITKIEDNDFDGCSMEYFVLPTSVETIESYAFTNCNSLSTFIIPQESKLTKIESNLNYGGGSYTGPFYCGLQNSILSIVCMLPKPVSTSYLFYHSTSIYGSSYKSTGKLYVPKNSVSLYENSNWEGQFADIIAIEDSEYSEL